MSFFGKGSGLHSDPIFETAILLLCPKWVPGRHLSVPHRMPALRGQADMANL